LDSLAPLIAHGLFSYQIGGSERIGADLAIECKNRGYNVICFAFYDTDGPIRAELESAGIPCVDLNYTTRKRPWRLLTYQLEFIRFLTARRVDSLIVHHTTGLLLCGLASTLARVRRVVLVEHGTHDLRERELYRRRAKQFSRFAHVITGVDGTIVDFFRDEIGVPAAKLRCIPNGVRVRAPDAATRNEMRRALGLEESDFVFLFVGRLQPVKDVPTLLAATAVVPAELRRSARVLIAGDGPELERLRAQASAAELDGTVRFLGARRDVPRLLMAADAFILTSVTEGQPMALIEAMAAGVPCIATAVGGIPALLGGGAGLLAAPGVTREIAAAMSRMMTSRELRSSCIDAARARILERHSLDSVVDRYLHELGLPRTPLRHA
jgi:glycosyltransferase involved in cell wall biosynthesis